MTSLKMLSSDEKLTEIRSLYFNATKQSIQQDIAKALDLLKSMPSEDERERATVYMEGLAEMQRDWMREPKARGAKRGGPSGKKGPGSANKGGNGRGARPASKGGATPSGANGSSRPGSQHGGTQGRAKRQTSARPAGARKS
ncbi:MAG: hypothetical protein U0Q11_21995 [Vicinamibacterales bacterium]